MTVVLGVPGCPGSPDSAEHDEPARLRREGLLGALARRGVPAVDSGDTAGGPPAARVERVPGDMRMADEVVAQAHRVREGVAAALAEHGPPLVVLGGDCSLALGAVPGARAALGGEVGLVWLGRFANANVPATSPSGDLAGMAIALLRGEGDPAVVRALGAPHLPADAVRLVARDLDPGEDAVLDRCGVRRVDLTSLDAPPGPLYVAIECGLLDPPDGPPLQDVEAALRHLRERQDVAVVALTGMSRHRVSASDVARLIAATVG